MEQLGGEHEGQSTSLWQVIGASVVGTVMEWYDFFIYGAAAALVFNQLFFPEFSPLAGTMAAFGTYALGFFARPVGGIIFGNLGDKIGRKAILVITLLLMGVATTLIGILPTFNQIGIWAAVLLLALRILQGLGAGAEFGGAVIMAAEYSPQDKRGLYASLPCTGVALGLLLSSGIFALFRALPEDQFLAWGWRIPFLLSIVVVGVGLYVRLRIMETPVFTHVKETHTEVAVPAMEVVRSQTRNLLVAIGARFSENGNAYLVQTFALTYAATQLGVPENTALLGVLISAALGLLAIPAFGALSDRVGRRLVYGAGSAFLLLFAFPLLLAAQYRINSLDLAGHRPGQHRGRVRDVLPAGCLLRRALRHPGPLQRDRDFPRGIRALGRRHSTVHRHGAARLVGQLLAGGPVHDRAGPHNPGGHLCGTGDLPKGYLCGSG